MKIVQNIAFKNEWTLDYKWYVITHPSLFPLTLLASTVKRESKTGKAIFEIETGILIEVKSFPILF